MWWIFKSKSFETVSLRRPVQSLGKRDGPSRRARFFGSFMAVAIAALALPGVAFAQAAEKPRVEDPQEHAFVEFRVKYRPLDPLAALVRARLSDAGEIALQPSRRVLRVRDAAERIEAIRLLVREYDVPLRRLEVVVKLIEASGASQPERISEEIREIGSRLRNVLRFTHYELLDTLVLEGLEGRAMSGHLGGAYRVSFSLGYVEEGGRVIPLEAFRFDRMIPAQEEGELPLYRNLVATALNLFDGEEILFGASRMEDESERALVLVISVRTLS